MTAALYLLSLFRTTITEKCNAAENAATVIASRKRLLPIIYCSSMAQHASLWFQLLLDGTNKGQIRSRCAVTNWLVMEIYVQYFALQLTKAKSFLVTRDYKIILTNRGWSGNDLFLLLQDEAGCGPHYLWVALKSRYRRMNVRLSLCVMGLIMVSCVPHNELHRHRKAISSSQLVWQPAHSSAESPA